MSKQKYYVVWYGSETGIFSTWEECSRRVTGQKNAKYKSFKTMAEAQHAFAMGYEEYRKATPVIQNEKTEVAGNPAPAINEAIAVDAACSGNPGAMEYRGVYLRDGKQLFHYGPVFGTNNIGEFLAIVHGLALLKQRGQTTMPIYSDSRNAMLWVKAKKCKTKLERNVKTEQLFLLIERAERWLNTNTYENPIIKWPTNEWGEIPADFGRK